MKKVSQIFFKFYFLGSCSFLLVVFGIYLGRTNFITNPSFNEFIDLFVAKSNGIPSKESLIPKEKLLQLPEKFPEPLMVVRDGYPIVELLSGPMTSIHQWKIDPNQTPLNFFERHFYRIEPFAAELLDHGDLIVSNEWGLRKHSFITRLDKDSNVKWFKATNVHHWFSVFENKIYTPVREFSTYEVVKRKYKLSKEISECVETEFPVDNVSVLNGDDGNVISSLRILDLISEIPEIMNKMYMCFDPLHLNDVRVLTQAQSNAFPNATKGDILISLRNVSTLALIDQKTLKIKWHMDTPFQRQHSPRITKRGTLVVFDNVGGSSETEVVSRIMEVNPKTSKVLGIYDGKEDRIFYSLQRGRISLNEEDEIFVANSGQKEVFKLRCPERQISNRCQAVQILFSNYKISLADVYSDIRTQFSR